MVRAALNEILKLLDGLALCKLVKFWLRNESGLLARTKSQTNLYMKTANAKAESPKMEGIIEMARLRVKIAEKRRAETKEHAREAKRKFKEMKALARRAKQEAKQAKTDLAEARDFLAEAETELAASVVPVATARKGRPISPTSSPESDAMTQATPVLGPENEAPTTSSVQTAMIVEKSSGATAPGVFGNWR